MVDTNRRGLLKGLGATVSFAGLVPTLGTAGTTTQPQPTLEKVGHSLLSDPPGGFAEAAVRDDGRYAVVGSFFGEGGSFLVDLAIPFAPEEVHRLPSSAGVRNADVTFDTRDGLYYRTQEPNAEGVEIAGVEIVDYGFEDGSVDDPTVVAELEAGATHNVRNHPAEDVHVVYTVNEHHADNGGMEVWDVVDPTEPELLGEAGPDGTCHDVVVDPERDLMHAAYIGLEGVLDGYVILDVSDPRAPEEVGRLDYAPLPNYSSTGYEGFENCHYADYDPDRELAVLGDEIAYGVPGGKHLVDVGWDEGSVEDPRPVGFVRSPNAELMDPDPDNDGAPDSFEAFDWTGHNFDVVPTGNRTLLVSGDYHDGTVLYDVSDPTGPVALDQYRTRDRAGEALGPSWAGYAPMAWDADYNEQRDLVVTSDMFTGIYVYEID